MDRHEIPQHIRRAFVLEIEIWYRQGWITSRQFDNLRRLYDFDFEPPPPAEIKPAAPPVQPPPVAPPPPPTPVARPTPVAQAAPRPPAEPPKPRPTLAQTLLSETSIKIALYMGAFFVISAALILAALVEVLRLPILAVITVLFAAGALVLKRRLPQPSFILYLVFSALLPITAGVLADTRDLSGRPLTTFWFFVLLGMALLWAFSTYLYRSRFFSLTALLALDGALIMGGSLIAGASWFLLVLGLTLSGLAGLGAAFLLKRWQNWRMALPVFVLSQVQQALILLALMVLAARGVGLPNTLVVAVTCILISGFMVLSHLLWRFILYPWLAAGVLMPVAWLAAIYFASASFTPEKVISYSRPVLIASAIALGGWGALYALVGTLFSRLREPFRAYALPASLGAVPLLLAGSLVGRAQGLWLGFGLCLGAAIVLALAHMFYRRTWVWTITLGFSLGAYLSFVYSIDKSAGAHACSWLAGATLLLLLPEMLPFHHKLSAVWRWPLRGWAILTGILALLAGLALHFLGTDIDSKTALVTLGIVGLVYLAYGIRIQRAWLGILFAVHVTLSLGLWLDRFQIHAWLPILTSLAVLFFGAGVLLKWLKVQNWSLVFRWSGLVLGAILSLAAFGYTGYYRAFYVAAMAAFFLVETFRYTAWVEFPSAVIVSLAYVMALYDARVDSLAYYPAGMAGIFLFLDLLYTRLKRTDIRWATRVVGFLAAILTPILVFVPRIEPNFEAVAIVALVYLLYGIFLRQSWLGILFSLYVTLSVILGLERYQSDSQLPILTCLAVLFYGCGVILKWLKAQGWPLVFRWSGLVLGLLLSLEAIMYPQSYRIFYVAAIAAIFLLETFREEAWLEFIAGFIVSLVFGMVMNEAKVEVFAYYPAGIAGIFLILDLIYVRLNRTGVRWVTRAFGYLAALLTVILVVRPEFEPGTGAIVCAGLTALFLIEALVYRQALVGYVVTVFFTISVLFADLHFFPDHWLWSMIGTAILFYALSILLDHLKSVKVVLLYSGLALASLTAMSAPFEGSGQIASIPVALAATLWAVEALRRRNVWLGFPANALYLMAYFMLLSTLDVDPHFYSVGAAVLGMLMHYLLVRAGSKVGAFIMGMASQLVLIGTAYIQFVGTENLWYFAVMFFESLAVLAYGIVIRSRSLVITPIVLEVIGVVTIVFGALRELSTVILVGITGIGLILLAIAALLMRERISNLRDLLKDWWA